MNRKDSKDAKFLLEPGAGPKHTTGFGSSKDAHLLVGGAEDSNV
jgi:hypothetical protein